MKIFSLDLFLRTFPSVFGIIISFISWSDERYIDAKVEGDQEIRGSFEEQIKVIQNIANGAVALSTYVLNVLLFNAGALLAILEWPRCLIPLPLLTCILLLALAFHDVLFKAVLIPFSHYRLPSCRSAGALERSGRRMFGSISLCNRLVMDQVLLNLAVILLILIGAYLGGAADQSGLCKVG